MSSSTSSHFAPVTIPLGCGITKNIRYPSTEHAVSVDRWCSFADSTIIKEPLPTETLQ